jgi:hypothetical protein
MTIVEKLRRDLGLQRMAAVLLITVSASASVAIVAGALFDLTTVYSAIVAAGVLCVLAGLYYFAGSLSRPPIEEIVRYLDRTYPLFEDSSGLYHQEKKNSLEQLQLQRIDRQVSSSAEKIKLPKKRLARSVIMSLMLLAASLLSSHFISLSGNSAGMPGLVSGAESEDVAKQEVIPDPVIESVQISITPPAYTGIGPSVENGGSVTTVTMSDLSWSIDISGDVEEAALIFNDRERIRLEQSSGRFTAAIEVEHRQIYRISASTRDATIYSDYFSIDVTEDHPPRFRVSSPVRMRTLLTERDPQAEMSVEIIDDYGIRETYLNATLARGSGESVRFREQRMDFDSVTGLGTARVQAGIALHSDSLDMTPGDELYFYVTATDNHPANQAGRSETYMLVVEDTTQAQSLMAGNIVIDLMPEDFRSQRQIIVDTEELISEAGRMNDEQFRLISRRIGRDQEMLMLEFGHYLGMDEESAGSGGDVSMMSDDDHQGHDHSVEAELDGEGQEVTQSGAASDIPDEFFHDHGSPEMNTLFAQSLRALLRRALSEMFRASQYLQTDRPEEALAYEYRALEFLQQAQQADRRYVRRAGLDGIPIPVDEERLTGTFDDFANPDNNYRSERTLSPILTIEKQVRGGVQFSAEDVERFNQAISRSDIPEGDKLYLLNRIERLKSSDENDKIRQQLLIKLSEINSNRQRNPAPVRIPVLGVVGGGE